jgi:hypothetical protein
VSFQPLDMEALVSNEEILQFDQDCLVGQGDRVFVERRLGSEVMPSISKKLKNWAFQALDWASPVSVTAITLRSSCSSITRGSGT